MAGSTKAMVVGSDDVGAVVIDCGSWEFRAGAAGDDTPRVVIPSAAGVRKVKPNPTSENALNAETVGADGAAAIALTAARNVTSAPLSYTDVSAVYRHDETTGSAIVSDWDAMSACWSASLRALRSEPSESPLLLVEPSRSWAPKARARALEVALEGLGAPAVYLARGSVMAAFAHARTTACVVDVGHQGATAVPVVEGFALQKATCTSNVGGRLISQRLAAWTDGRLAPKSQSAAAATAAADGDVHMAPAPTGDNTATAAKPGTGAEAATGTEAEAVSPNGDIRHVRAPHEVARRNGKVVDISGEERFSALTSTHRTFHRMRVIHDMKAALLRVEPTTGGEGDEAAGALPIPQSVRDALKRPTEYTLPDGQKVEAGGEGGGAGGSAIDFANALFDEGDGRGALSRLAFEAATQADADVRRELYNGVVLTGGCALIPGALERFSRELALLTPQQYKLKVLGAAAAIERTAAPWIGGSIVASLGTFQNAWVAKCQYDEEGAINSLGRCP